MVEFEFRARKFAKSIVWMRPDVLSLLGNAISSSPGYTEIIVAVPEHVPRDWVQKAAYFQWEKSGQPKRSAAEQDAEYRQAEDVLRNTPLGMAIVFHASYVTDITYIALSDTLTAAQQESAYASMLDELLKRANSSHIVQCTCAIGTVLRRILEERGFRGSQVQHCMEYRTT